MITEWIFGWCENGVSFHIIMIGIWVVWKMAKCLNMGIFLLELSLKPKDLFCSFLRQKSFKKGQTIFWLQHSLYNTLLDIEILFVQKIAKSYEEKKCTFDKLLLIARISILWMEFWNLLWLLKKMFQHSNQLMYHNTEKCIIPIVNVETFVFIYRLNLGL